MMETLAIIGLVSNIVQFLDFSGRLISKSAQLYRSGDALAENVDIETATSHLILLNDKLKDAATATSDGALESLCKSCDTVANMLLVALENVKVKDKQRKWESMRKALKSIWNKKDIEELERRLAGFREVLNLHIVMGLRYIRESPVIGSPDNMCAIGNKSLNLSWNGRIASKTLIWQQKISSMLSSNNRISFTQRMIHNLL